MQQIRTVVGDVSVTKLKVEVSRICIDSDYHTATLGEICSTIIMLYLKSKDYTKKLRERKTMVLSRGAVKTIISLSKCYSSIY